MASNTTLISTPASLSTLLDTITSLPTSSPSLFFDLEGISLSRTGSISIFQLLLHPSNHIYLIDIYLLASTAFQTPGSHGQTLKDILESPTISKVCFDVRNDSDALYAHFGIALQGIQDIQLMENASRSGPRASRRFLNGLFKCILNDAPISAQQKQSWRAVKDRGAELFAPDKGGDYRVFNARPLKEEILAYCVQDVRFLPLLRETYWGRLSVGWKGKVEDETKARVRDSQSVGYQPHGQQKALGPWL